MKTFFAFALVLGACSAPVATDGPAHSSSLAISSDDKLLWVANPDADSVSVIDLTTRTLQIEIALGPTPTVGQDGRFDPLVRPRSVALAGTKVYVACQSSGEVVVIDAVAKTVLGRIPIGAEPVAVVAASDAVYVVDHQAATVSKIDTHTDQVVGMLTVTEHPWGASLSGGELYITHLLLHAGVTSINTQTFTVDHTVELVAGQPDARSKLIPSGLPRGVYAAVPRPLHTDLWLPHLLLAVTTPQPTLDFQSTVFPTITTLHADLGAGPRYVFLPLGVAGAIGSFTDVVSGPRDLAFTPDGTLALQVNSGSEDVLVFDADSGNERGLVRPLPSTTPEGIVVDHAGLHAYVEGRSSHDITVLAIHATDKVAPVTVDGPAISRLQNDPMPANLRLGQRLFFTSNSSAFPISSNFWVSCSSCHLEGGTDAVTWKFITGPRDTPSNAGGPINTGFLFRQALRDSVVEYDKTIRVEQGGAFHRDTPAQVPLLDALAAFVNEAIPLPRNPHPATTRGQAVFNANCASCHSGPWLTDSGAGNPTLDLAGSIMLHDVGTCVQGTSFDDVATVDDVLGKPRTACDFDTPTLRGIFATPPYFHDGSAATLRDVVDRLPMSSNLAESDKADLVEYLNGL